MNLKLLSVFVFFLILSSLSTAQAAIRTFPGAAPCNTGLLQDCTNGADDGDVIEIATNDRIDQPLSIIKSVTLRPAAGFTATIGSADLTAPRVMSINDDTSAPMVVNLLDLNLDGMKINALFNLGDDDELNIIRCRLVNDEQSTSGYGVNLTVFGVSAFAVIRDNFIAAPGEAIFFWTQNFNGSLETALIGNTVTTRDSAFAEQGMRIRADSEATIKVDILNNLIYGVGQEGLNMCLELEAQDSNLPAPLTSASFNVNHNTLDDCWMGIRTWHVQDGYTDLDLNLFNNSFSNMSTEGVSYAQQMEPPSTLNNDFNNFFNVPTPFSANTFSSPGLNSSFEDPLYQDPADGNYRLQASSPLIGAGTNTPPLDLSQFDAERLPRLAGDVTDMGAFEAQADLALTQTVSPGTVTTGGSVTYTLTVANNGLYDAVATLTDSLPAGADLQSASASQGSCNDSAPLACSLGTLPAGASATVTLSVVLNQAGTALNDASVEGDLPDSNPADNAASASVQVDDPDSPPASSSGGCGLQGETPQAQGFTLLLALGLIIASRVGLRGSQRG